jgi:hypothetical protein
MRYWEKLGTAWEWRHQEALEWVLQDLCLVFSFWFLDKGKGQGNAGIATGLACHIRECVWFYRMQWGRSYKDGPLHRATAILWAPTRSGDIPLADCMINCVLEVSAWQVLYWWLHDQLLHRWPKRHKVPLLLSSRHLKDSIWFDLWVVHQVSCWSSSVPIWKA